MRTMCLTTSILALTAGAALAQESTTDQSLQQQVEQVPGSETVGAGEIRTLAGWNYDPLYADSRSVDSILADSEVFGESDEQIGDVENVIFDADGNVLAVIAEVGGLWDIGDTHVSVPWDEVEVGGDGSLTVPVAEDNVGDYSVFGENGFYQQETASEVAAVDDDISAGEGVFKATDLIGDYAYLTGGEQYGYVSDVLLHDGKIAAVVIDAAAYGAPGYYAYPYYGYAYDAAEGGMDAGMQRGANAWRYGVGYDAEDITVIETFDYEQMQNGARGGETRG